MSWPDIVVVGGGAAGMMAAIAAARQGASVTLIERNQKVGRKLYITGKGRCNVTNHCAPEEVRSAIPRNGKFLYSALEHTPPAWVEEFFESLGVKLKVERGNRVFPASDKSADIIDALFFELKRLRVAIVNDRVSQICLRDGAVCGVEMGNSSKTRTGIPCKAVVLATGGLSYPATGSTGDGHRMAEELGHTIVEPRPSLVPLESPDGFCARMQGLALKNVVLTVKNSKKKTVYQEQGELLFTHFGLSGPLVLSASAHMRDFEKEQYTCAIDLKPALDEPALDARLVRELSAGANKDMDNVMGALAPRLLVPVLLERAGIPGNKKARDLTKQERRRLLELFKHFTVAVSGPRPIDEAIITSGGVRVSEADPKTMQSKRVPGLFFAGELLDVDAYTGGFNLQIAWATGRAAGEGAVKYLGESMDQSNSDVKLGRFLSLVLRHDPGAAGITLDEHGWADVKALLAGVSRTGRKINMDTLERIVRENNKQRYSFNEDHTKIRANQGHSVKVDVELKETEPPRYLYHGTATRFFPAIQREGIRKMSRQYVHLSGDFQTAMAVGKRHGIPMVITIDAAAMAREGVSFYRSENGVWLCEHVEPKYFVS